MNALNYLIAAIAGVSFVFQQAVNSNLRVEIASPWWAGFVSYLGGTVVMLFAALVLREPLSLASISATSISSWTGGIFRRDLYRDLNLDVSQARCCDRNRTSRGWSNDGIDNL